MMKKAKVFLCSLLVLCAVFFCMTALAAEDIVFTFENDASLAGWSTSYLRYNFDPGCFAFSPDTSMTHLSTWISLAAAKEEISSL